MNRLIIIEGPQGTGKTTLANYLRETIPSSNLYRLSGQSEKGIKGKEISKKMYFALLKYLKEMEQIPIDLIFDRSFLTEEVYARLGYKEYSFTEIYQELLQQLTNLNYQIYFVILYLRNQLLYEERLKREQHHLYQEFSRQNSINQQEMYLQLAKEIKNPKIEVIPLEMDDFTKSYSLIREKFL